MDYESFVLWVYNHWWMKELQEIITVKDEFRQTDSLSLWSGLEQTLATFSFIEGGVVGVYKNW